MRMLTQLTQSHCCPQICAGDWKIDWGRVSRRKTWIILTVIAVMKIRMLLILLVESMHMVMIHLILSSNEDCSFIGFYCSYFPGSLDFLLQIQLWRCYLNFLVVSSGKLEHLMKTVLFLHWQSICQTLCTSSRNILGFWTVMISSSMLSVQCAKLCMIK